MEASHSSQNQDYHSIPHPPKLPVIGNLHLLSSKNPTQGVMKLAEKYGPIFRIHAPFGSVIVLSDYEHVKDVLNENFFIKNVSKPLLELRGLGGDGLFTSWTHEPSWQKAHNILLPGLGQRAMKGYYPMMLDIVESLLAKWHNIPENNEFNLTDDMTRLTLDTIGLCGFDYRFHSFASEQPHPFVKNMLVALEDAMNRMNKFEFQKKLRFLKNIKNRKAENKLYEIVDEIIQERKQNPEKYLNKTDLLSLMMNATDTVSGEKLDDINIRFQVITFLIAGHETTSGLLSFAFYYLMTHPEFLQKAYQEVDTVLGNDLNKKPTYKEVLELRYIQQILNESLRLWPTAPAFALYAKKDTSICEGKYPIQEKQPFIVLLPGLHRDPKIWGNDAEKFNPEHFNPENVEKRPADAFKPFGNGQRACIGRQFAMLEATLAMGMILQRYKLRLTDNYKFIVKETLTIKPENLMVSLRKRKDHERTYTQKPSQKLSADTHPGTHTGLTHQTPILALFGSNMGASEDIAIQIAEHGLQYGFQPQLAPLNDYTDQLVTEGLLVIVCSTYNGTPPENAARFFAWLQSDLPKNHFHGLKYTVFGCGNRQWKTFQNVPRYIDERLTALGATRVYKRGEADASADFEEDFESWYRDFWKTIHQSFKLENTQRKLSTTSNLNLEIIQKEQYQKISPTVEAPILSLKILENRELQNKTGNTYSDRSTRHIEFQLPNGVTYQAGDHLGIYPQNPAHLIGKVCTRFGIKSDTVIRLSHLNYQTSHLPLHQDISVEDLLTHYLELQEVATKRQVKILAEYTECPPEKQKLLQWLGEDEASKELFKKEVLERGLSVLDLLIEFPACEVPFEVYLDLLSSLKVRYFSISSSSLNTPNQCSITVGVLNEEAWSGKGIFEGICTNYLAKLDQGNHIRAFIQKNHAGFYLPKDSTTPIILIGAGTGLAPFMGFLQERATQGNQNIDIGQTLLFFGCRHPRQDYIYQEELQSFVDQSFLEVFTAFSRAQSEKVYVQDRLMEQTQRVWESIQNGAIIYVCGDAHKLAPGVRQAFIDIHQQMNHSGISEANHWLERMVHEKKYLEDVWA